MNHEDHDRQWERQAEEEIQELFRQANVPMGIDGFKNNPELQRRIIERLNELNFADSIGRRYPELIGILKNQKEISTMEIPESEGMIDKGYKIGLIGEMQSGKSLLSLRIGQDLVEGRPILNYFPWDKKWRVLYVNFELPEDEMITRFSFFGNNPNYVLLNMTIIDLEQENESRPIIDVLKAYREAGKPFDALILDPKVCCFGGDENQTHDTLRWCAACDRLAKEDNLCLIIPHHFGANANTRAGRGNTTFGGWLTKRLLLKGGDGATRKTLTVRGKVGEPLVLPLKLTYPFWEVEAEAIRIKESKISEARTFILTHIPADRTPLIKEANQAQTKITLSTFKEAQKQLENEGLIGLEQIEGQPGNRKRIIPLSN
jgi:hypothetical protein